MMSPGADADILVKVTVVGVSYNTRDVLRTCLNTLGAPGGPGVEIVIVDNASGDGSADMVEREFPSVKLVRSSTNTGFGAAANRGVAAATREYVLFLNPDCAIHPEDVATLAGRLAAEPGLGFVGPKIVLESGRVDHASLRADPDPIGAALYLSRATRLFPRNPRVNRYSLRHLDYDEDQELLAGTAACLMVPAAAFREIGGFDEAFFMYGEDLDLCRRLRQAGYRGRYVSSAVARHSKGESSRKNSGAMLREFHRAMWIYYTKHEAGLRPAPVNAIVRVGILALGGGRLALNALRRERRVSAR